MCLICEHDPVACPNNRLSCSQRKRPSPVQPNWAAQEIPTEKRAFAGVLEPGLFESRKCIMWLPRFKRFFHLLAAIAIALWIVQLVHPLSYFDEPTEDLWIGVAVANHGLNFFFQHRDLGITTRSASTPKYHSSIFGDYYVALARGEIEISIHLIWLAVFFVLLAFLTEGIRRAIVRRRVAWTRCGECSYNLTGNISGICPECGTPT